jgi:hypothetical protein
MSATHTRLGAVVGTAMAAAICTVALAGPANAYTEIGGVSSFAKADYDACNHRVDWYAQTDENLDGRWTMYYRVAVYDGTTGTWYWSRWILEDGSQVYYTNSPSPGQSIYVQNAKVVNGQWVYAGEYVPIDYDTLDNQWCNGVNVETAAPAPTTGGATTGEQPSSTDVPVAPDRPAVPDTRLGPPKIDHARRTATFAFSAVGAASATSTECALVRVPAHGKAPAPHFVSCAAPKTTRTLAHGRYVFSVRARSAAGVDPTPARRTFTL